MKSGYCGLPTILRSAWLVSHLSPQGIFADMVPGQVERNPNKAPLHMYFKVVYPSHFKALGIKVATRKGYKPQAFVNICKVLETSAVIQHSS